MGPPSSDSRDVPLSDEPRWKWVKTHLPISFSYPLPPLACIAAKRGLVAVGF